MRASGLLQQEAARGETRLQSDADLRRTIGTYLERCRLAALAARGCPLSPVAILTRDPGVGNPVAMAADRLAPAAEAGADLGDTIARLVRKACRLAGHAPTPYWTPDLQRRPEPEDAEEVNAPVMPLLRAV